MKITVPCKGCGEPKTSEAQLLYFTIKDLEYGPEHYEDSEISVEVDGVSYPCKLSSYTRHYHMFGKYVRWDLTFKILYYENLKQWE